MQKHYNYLTIDLDRKIYNTLNAIQSDSKSRYILVSLVSNNLAYDLTGTSVKIYGIKKDKTIFFNSATIIDTKNGQFEIELTNQALATTGYLKIQILVTGANQERLTTSHFFINVNETIVNDTAIESTNEFTALTNALSEVQNIDNKFTKVDEQFISIEQQKANGVDVKNKYYDVNAPLLSNNTLTDMEFKRKHARNLFKNLQYRISGMDFYRNFLGDENGNMYPQLESNGTTLTESVSDFTYKVKNNDLSGGAQSRRLIGAFNLFSTYDITIKDIIKTSKLGVRCGIDISNVKDNQRYCMFVAFTNDNKLEVRSEMFVGSVSQGVIINYSEENYTNTNARFLFTVRENQVDVYKVENEVKTFLTTINIITKLNSLDLLSKSRVGLFTRLNWGESVVYTKVENYFDSGISQGDIKPIKYKNGAPIIKNGRIYFTMSSRFEGGAYQTIISQNISGCDYKLEGVIYYIVNGTIGQDLASSIIYDNESGKFLIWNACFNGTHILSYGEAYCDILHGVNYVNMNLMQGTAVNDTDFLAKVGDEDPDFFYNYETGKWYLIICRLVYDNEVSQDMYRYFLFESDNPFTNYVFKDKTLSGSNTGGSIVKVGGKYCLVCGSNYHVTSQYNIYDLDDLSTFKSLIKDFADGGFRGWGTIFAIPCGNFTKYGWITFDREKVGEGTWSYGNIYYYESNLLNEGCEYNIKYSY